MSVDAAFWLLGLTTLVCAAFGVWRYGTFLNPLSIFCVADIGVFTIGSGIVAISGPSFFHYTDADIVTTALLALVFLLGFTSTYLSRSQVPARLFGQGVSLLGLSSDTFAARFSPVKFGLLLLGFLVSFVGLAVVSGAGLLWLTNPREAYQNHRTGVGPFELATNWCLSLAFLYYLWSRRPRGAKLLLVTACFCVAMSFMGSKNNILALGVVALAYYNFQVKHVSGLVLMSCGLGGLAVTFGLLVLQGSYASLYEALFYFRDYFDTSAAFISRFDEFGFLYGRGWLSSLWFYAPRSLFPGKPYEYGNLLINKVLFPGAAALGGTPGSLTWDLSYLDFGTIGVFFDGLILGLFRRMAYENYFRQPRSFFAFVFMLQISLWPVFIFAVLPYLILLLVFYSVFIQVVVRPSIVLSAQGDAAITSKIDSVE